MSSKGYLNEKFPIQISWLDYFPEVSWQPQFKLHCSLYQLFSSKPQGGIKLLKEILLQRETKKSKLSLECRYTRLDIHSGL